MTPSLLVSRPSSLPGARVRTGGLLGLLAFLPSLASAHERFVKHDMKNPLQDSFFLQKAGMLFGMDPNMIQIGLLVSFVLSAFLFIWFLRDDLDEFIRYKVLSRLGGWPQRALHKLASYIMDKPVRSAAFYTFGEWSVIMFLRSPALVLMFAATNDALVMPSYPLEPSSAVYFKFLQVALGVLILTQTLLPLCGAMVIGTWFYLFRWGPFVAIDAIPVLTAGILYAMSPWISHKLAITRLNVEQARWIRFVFGVGFFILGWSKIYNHDLTIGVADNYPSMMSDPLVGFFALGTDPAMRREAWVVSFALAEVMSGFMVMMGVFTRLWATIM
ncbi:MAG: DoxX family membrane protein, partial [Vicinamibacteria bacterium]|nr:DoxX family membrane protein [Vicinamibacteria bacterium]